MDLVDIDQVLDDLELCEAADENKAAIARHAAVAASAAAPSNGIITAPKSSNSLVQKNFVGVSQVFNSLDDYCKNVESLETTTKLQQYDEECRSISLQKVSVTKTTADDVSTQENTINSLVMKPEEVQQIQNQNAREEATNQVVEDDEEEEEEETEGDTEEACSDIHKFKEKRRGWPVDSSEDVSITSDSLTTSSSSTFSSGPSPGAASTADEGHSTPISPEAPLERSDSIDGSEEVLEQNNVAIANSEPSNSHNNVVNEKDKTPEQQTESSSEPIEEDLAQGLSSISLTTTTTANSQLVLPCESNVSSALKNVLDQLSDTDSTSFLSQRAAEEKERLLAEKTKNMEQSKTPDNDAEECMEKIVQEINAPKAVDVVKAVVQQPITFGSTMDEISDTELDSMLQEMDVDEVETVATATTNNKIESIESNKISLEKPSNELVGATAEVIVLEKKNEELEKREKLETPIEVTNSSEVINNVGDCINGDSLSQASTVEFSEVRAQAQIANAENAQSQNSIASSYTSSESSTSSLDGEDAAISADGEAEDEVQERDAVRPVRPTSLDLSTVKTSLYVNAGQTPPGNMQQQQPQQTQDVIPPPNMLEENTDPAVDESVGSAAAAGGVGYNDPIPNLGKIPPIWVADNMAANCMTCQTKFTMIKRRHHCRACGKVLCSVCCSQKFKLEFLEQPESRVCVQCYLILVNRQRHVEEPISTSTNNIPTNLMSASNSNGIETAIDPTVLDDDNAAEVTREAVVAGRSPNPNNPMEYCSTIPPHRQVSATAALQPPPTVIVPVGVLKKDCSYSSTSSNSSRQQMRKRKSVMFSDGIAPGSDLATLEHEQWHDAKQARNAAGGHEKTRNNMEDDSKNKPSTPAKPDSSVESSTAMGLMASLFRGAMPPAAAAAAVNMVQGHSHDDNTSGHSQSSRKIAAAPKKTDSVTTRLKRLLPIGYDANGCFIPTGDNNKLPPIYTKKDERGVDYGYKEIANNTALLERLQNETLNFALDKNFFVRVKIVHLKCCMNRTVINFTTCGMHFVGNDEIIILLELTNKDDLSKEPPLPKDIFQHLYEIYTDAEQGNPIMELSHTSPRQNNFLGSREYGGFIYIRNTYQCLQDVIVPENPFLIGILIHRYEVPWAKVFPLRLMLRLGAQYRYYPCPHISMRNRESVYAEIAQTIINFLADFRNYTYTLPSIRGLYIHMEDRRTTILIPKNRLDEVIKAINNASDHILAFGGNFSKAADGHLVCMQNVNDERNEMYSYSTQAINIQGQPRRVTGASFFVLNEALKSSSGLSGKCSIVEDGLMVQIMPTKMEEVRNALRNQKDIEIVCGPLNASEEQTETVSIKWIDFDRDFNIGVTSPIDGRSLEGVSSVRVHASFNYSNANLSVRLTEIYIIKYEEWYNTSTTVNAAMPLDITRIAGQISRSVSMAMVPYLDLLVQNGIDKFALRATLHQDNVCYEAGALGDKLPPLYMNALDDNLISTLHNESSGIEEAIILELKFYILSV